MMISVLTNRPGSITIRFEVDSPGGHSSVPPPHTSIGILAQLIVAFEDQPYGSTLVCTFLSICARPLAFCSASSLSPCNLIDSL